MNQDFPTPHQTQTHQTTTTNSVSNPNNNPPQTMDKKNYSTQPSSTQRYDGSGGNQLAKSYARSQYRNRNQSTNSNVSNPKQDPASRRSNSQKTSYVDKRPRPRTLGDSEQVVQTQSEPEIGSLQSPGSKKQNLNHLLNFHFAPREHRTPDSNRAQSRGSGSSKVTRPKYLKESFIQANCQFLVKPNKELGDYGAYKYDPDHLVEWDSIEQIVLRTYGGMPNCPICLEPYPCAAKMTKCGHIFCWPCCYGLAFHLEGSTQPCPICFEPIALKDLKSVVANVCEELHIDDELEFQLMCRPKDSSAFESPVYHYGDWERRYHKLVVVDKDQVNSEVLDREEAELACRFAENLESLEAQFVSSAMEELENRRKKLIMDNMSPIFEIPEESQTSSDSGLEGQASGNSLSVVGKKDSYETLKERDWSAYYIFYQVADGRCAYVNQMNMAMLWKSFGEDPLHWPQIIRFKILEAEDMTMTMDLRKRLKSLQHIPLNTSLQLLEVELEYPLVPEEVLNDFSFQINQRKQRRAERAKLEKRRDREHAAAEKRKYPPRPKISNPKDFPSFGAIPDEQIRQAIEESLRLRPHCVTINYNKLDFGIATVDSSESLAERVGNFRSETSLASSTGSMVGIGTEASGPHRLTYSSIASAPAPPRQLGCKSSPSMPQLHHKPLENLAVGDKDSEDESGAAPTFRASMSDAITKALEGVQFGDGQAAGTSGTGQQKKKGKKKNNKILLFATGMDMGHK